MRRDSGSQAVPIGGGTPVGLTVPIIELAPSYLHMHGNRLLRSGQRAHELLLYDLLARQYESELAQGHKQIGGHT